MDARRRAPAVARNRGPILDVLRRSIPSKGRLLEVASGTGEHAVHFAREFPGLRIQPSDPDPEARASIGAWAELSALPNLLAPLTLDVERSPWPIQVGDEPDAIVCINMVHISPWSACLALFDGAERWLRPGSPLVLYGPYREAGRPTAASNVEFDESLRARNPDWGLRDREVVEAEARARGFELEERVEMPANNLTLVFRKRPER